MKKILFVGDDPARLDGYSTFLEKENFEVIRVGSDGDLGYKKGRSEHYDLIILAFHLYGKNGIDICCDLRKDGITTPILLYGDHTDERSAIKKYVDLFYAKMEAFLEFGATDYIYYEPLTLKRLLHKVKTLLG